MNRSQLTRAYCESCRSFEIHPNKPNPSIQFYSEVFGWQFNRWGQADYWLIIAGPDDRPGVKGGLIEREHEVEGRGVNAHVCTIEVNSVSEMLRKISTNGGQIVTPKTPLAGTGCHAHFLDTEENIIGIVEYNEIAE